MTQNAVVRVREARPEEDGRIGELLVDAFVSSYARELPEVVVSEERKADLRDIESRRKRGAVLIAEIEGKVVGSVTVVRPGDEKSEAWKPRAADLRQLGIDLSFRGRGISDLLVEEAERIAISWGCEVMCLHVRRGARGVAGFYQKRGYLRDATGDIDKRPEIYLEAFYRVLKGNREGIGA